MIYSGSLNEKKMSRDARRAYDAWKNQRRRCNDPRNKSFRNYGSKKISVHYSSREFIGWFLRERKNFSGKKPIVGRIDHDKGYSLDNIKLETRTESSLEMLDRTKRRKPVGVFDKHWNLLFAANSAWQAATWSGESQGNIVTRCKTYEIGRSRTPRNKNGYRFKYIK